LWPGNVNILPSLVPSISKGKVLMENMRLPSPCVFRICTSGRWTARFRKLHSVDG
jgi:hypothetical protein